MVLPPYTAQPVLSEVIPISENGTSILPVAQTKRLMYMLISSFSSIAIQIHQQILCWFYLKNRSKIHLYQTTLPQLSLSLVSITALGSWSFALVFVPLLTLLNTAAKVILSRYPKSDHVTSFLKTPPVLAISLRFKSQSS